MTQTTKPTETKSAAIRRLLSRKTGADLATLQKATGWQPHSVRAALSTLRKSGYTVDRVPPKKEGGAVSYKITGAPARDPELYRDGFAVRVKGRIETGAVGFAMTGDPVLAVQSFQPRM